MHQYSQRIARAGNGLAGDIPFIRVVGGVVLIASVQQHVITPDPDAPVVLHPVGNPGEAEDDLLVLLLSGSLRSTGSTPCRCSCCPLRRHDPAVRSIWLHRSAARARVRRADTTDARHLQHADPAESPSNGAAVRETAGGVRPCAPPCPHKWLCGVQSMGLQTCLVSRAWAALDRAAQHPPRRTERSCGPRPERIGIPPVGQGLHTIRNRTLFSRSGNSRCRSTMAASAAPINSRVQSWMTWPYTSQSLSVTSGLGSCNALITPQLHSNVGYLGDVFLRRRNLSLLHSQIRKLDVLEIRKPGLLQRLRRAIDRASVNH